MNTCIDDDDFRDVRGFGCATWNLRSRNCAHIERDFGYTTAQANRVRSACKVACGTCTSDRALIHHVGVPRSYHKSLGPYPLFLYFHGWGGNGEECGNVCDHARSNGFVTVAMRGMGPDFYASWNGFGSTESPGSDGPTCNVDTSEDLCYDDCNPNCRPCWWTTCRDSVAQVKAVLRSLSSALCLDNRQVFASGCSNGAMFLYTLARDSEFSLRTIAPVVGLPHNGFNFGPLEMSTTRFIGYYGLSDTTVPPLSNTNDPTKSYDTTNRGW